MKNPFSSLSVKLALAFFLCAVLPAGVGLHLFASRAQEASLQAVELHQREVATDRNRLLELQVASIQRDVALLAESELMRRFVGGLSDSSSAPNEELGALAEDLIHSTQARLWGATHHVFVTDAEGLVVLSPPKGEYDIPCRAPFGGDLAMRQALGNHLGNSIADTDFFAPAIEQPLVTSFFGFEERDHYHQLVLHPIRMGERSLGLVVAEIAIDGVEQLLSRDVDLGHSGQVALVTRNGVRVVHSKDEERSPLNAGGLRTALDTGTLAFTSDGMSEGREVVGTYLPSTIYPWVVSIEADRNAVLAPTRETQALLLRVLAALAIVLSLAGVGLGLWFGIPLRRCALAARRVGEGNLEQQIPITRGLDEIGVMERASESMRRRLLEHIQKLDENVLVRTRELQEALAQIQQSEERFVNAVAGSMHGLWEWDLVTERVYYAPRWKELVGAGEDEVGDTPDEWYRRISSEALVDFDSEIEEHIQGRTERIDLELEMVHADGEPRWMLCRAQALRDASGKALRLAGSLADITALKRAQQEVRHMASHDGLTGLPNREFLKARLQHAVARQRRHPDSTNTYAVLFFDFDRFKVINDSLGHSVGDALLISIAERMRENIRDVDTAARFGGDEFVVLLEDVDGVEGAEQFCERMLEVFEAPHHLGGHEVVSTASIGLVVGNLAYDDAGLVLRDADAAMYHAKEEGRAQFRSFDDVMFERAKRRMLLEQDLRTANLDEQFCVLYQPIVSMRTFEVEGFEALVRWDHPSHGRVSPNDFIPIAEETGLVVPLGEWILRTACEQFVEWRKEFGGERPLFMNVNLSRRQLCQPNLLPMLRDVVAKFDLQPGDLKLEITETTVMDERFDTVPVMQAIKNLGILLAMDDFGTGQSSLSCLHQFPIDVLKIDRSFIVHIEERPQFTAVMQAIVMLAHHLDLQVVAEGIENEAQLAQLQVMDCEYAQGFLFSKPQEVEAATELLRGGLRPRSAA